MKKISTIESVLINKVPLYFSINKENSNKPIILYLHGGPGDSCIPLTQKFNYQLEEEFNFINLEQRGAGLSYYKFHSPENLTIATMVEDIYQFVLYILQRFNQEKLILIGHSWGSVLGIKFIQKYPHLVSMYIGVGQVVNMEKNIELQRQFVEKHGENTTDLDFENDLIQSSLKITKQIVKNKGSLYNEKNYNRLTFPFLFSSSYSFFDLVNRLKGSKQSINYFWEELMLINFENIKEYPIPVFFFEGRNDNHVSSVLAADYCSRLISQSAVIWFEKSGHFPQWEEPEKFNQEILKITTNS